MAGKTRKPGKKERPTPPEGYDDWASI